jgi:hypothetical protein
MKQKIGTGVAAVITVLVVVIVALIGWRTLASSTTVEPNEEATFREAEKKAKANGVDLRTIPEWAPRYYKYHPEEKPPDAAGTGLNGAPAMAPPPASGGAPAGNGTAPPVPPTMNMPPPPPGGR